MPEFRLRPGAALLAFAFALGGCALTLETVVYDAAPDRIVVADIAAPDGGSTGDTDADDAPAVDGSADDGGADDAAMGADADDAAPSDATDACVPQTERCNGLDDDCDGVPDNGLGSVTCGHGACARTVPTCVAGTPVACVPDMTSASAEVCNGRDDNCDGTVDDGVPLVPCGLGACQQLPTACGDTCVPRPAVPEICGNMLDDDCDGVVDDCPSSCDRYVRLGASGTGTGTASPMGFINSAITALAATGGTVCVAAQVTSGACVATTYVENVTMVEGVTVLGNFHGGTWARGTAGCETIIRPRDGNVVGVLFEASITNATALDGFTIEGNGNPAGASMASTAAVTIRGGGRLTGNVIRGGPSSDSIGVRVVGVAGSVRTAPLIAGNGIFGGSSASVFTSVGVRVTDGSPEIVENERISGGSARNRSIGFDGTDARGTMLVSNATIVGGSSNLSTAVRFTGDVTGTVVARNTVRGSPTSATLAMPFARGIHYEACRGTASLVFANAITGGSGLSPAVGIDVLDCAVLIDSNAQIVGRMVAGGDAFGVRCSGPSANCTVRSNARIVGLDGTSGSAPDARAVSIVGSALGRVRDNRDVVGCTAPAASTCVGIELDGAAAGSLVDGNVVLVGRGMNDRTFVAGIRTATTPGAVISNNLVFADASFGIVVNNGARGDGTVHSNTVVSVATSAGARPTHLYAVNNESFTATMAVFQNNIGVCLDGIGTAFKEAGSLADPTVFENNDFFQCAVLYEDFGGASLTTAAAINALRDIPMCGGNIDTDPMFISSSNFHLAPGSPAIDTGTAAGAPGFDGEGGARPQGAGFDIGYDEVGAP